MQDNINNKSMLRVGTILRGIYRIDSYLSSGGFGNTYVATNVEFDERVAIKEFFMKGVSQRDENQTTVSVSNSDNTEQFGEQREKFKKEARRLRKLHNDHLVRVHDLFEENGTAYYVMDYVDGENLSERLKRTAKPMGEDEVWSLLPQVLDALSTVHGHGIWHLDLKPANIMVDKQGTVKLIDFGASKQLTAKGGITTSTAVSYTNGFAPREQMEQNLDKFGPWTDLYSLGATLYNLLSGKKPPLPTDIDDDISDDKHLALPMPENISGQMRQLVLWLMNTNRAQRPQSVQDVQNRITQEETEQTIIRPKDKPQTPQPMPPTPNPAREPEAKPKGKPKKNSEMKWVIIGGAVIVLLLAIILLGTKGCSGSSAVGDDSSGSSATAPDTLNVTTAFGDCEYVGETDSDGLPNGQGMAFFSDGSYYLGPFEHGDINGKDAYYKNEDGDTFEGEFRDNTYYEGKYTIASDGSYFVGTYKDGGPAKGKWYDKNGNIIGEI